MTGHGIAAGFGRLKRLLPEEAPAAPVEYTAPLVGFVGALVLVSVPLAIVTFVPVDDPFTLTLGALVVFVAAYCSVRMTGGVDSLWTASVFVHLALTFTFGPVGAICGAVAQAAAVGLRMKTGTLRTVFNGANYFLTDISAWLVFSTLLHVNSGALWGACSGTLAAVVECTVNTALLAVVIRLASRGKASGWQVFRRTMASLILYNIGYGWAAYGAVLLHQVAGTVGFTTTLVPVVLLQGFLVLLARRIKAQEVEREEHTKEREALLQQAITASDAERKRIASDLHDGVVQSLAGLAFSLAARGAGKVPDQQLLDAAVTLRSSVTDLRTLMIEIAPPDLAQTGVDGALRKLLEPLPARGIAVDMDAAVPPQLSGEATSLVFRVAQEAVRNVVNHSHATKVQASLHLIDDVLTLRIVDNGNGFSAADRSRRRDEGHVGLHLLNNAVEARGGRLSLDSEPGQGTSLMLQLPCQTQTPRSSAS